jgi:hypothetical protein
MSNEVSIFKSGDVALSAKKTPSALTQSLMKKKALKRIVAKNGILRRLANGEEVGKLKAPLRVVIVNASTDISRTFYAKTYDPNAEAAPPDCWSPDGRKPDASVKQPQGKTCETCPKNIAGSGQGNTKACRYGRRIAVVLPDDLDTNVAGDVYQMQLSAKSIFGKGSGHTFPFNAFIDYIFANGSDLESVVTEISFNEDNDNQTVLFKAVDFVSKDPQLEAIVAEAAVSETAQKAVVMSVYQTDTEGKTNNEEFEQSPVPKAEKAKAEAVEAEEVAEPTKRASKPKAEVSDTPKKTLADVVSDWSDD